MHLLLCIASHTANQAADYCCKFRTEAKLIAARASKTMGLQTPALLKDTCSRNRKGLQFLRGRHTSFSNFSA
jgi:hypothetical protein